MRIFLTGGTGFIGGHALQRFLRDGHHVVASARTGASAAALQAAGAKPFCSPLTTGLALQTALEGCDAVVHGAAHLRMWGTWDEFEASNLKLTHDLLLAAQAAGVQRFVHVSAASVVMQSPGPLLDVDESAPTTRSRDLPYSTTKAQAEALVLQAATPGFRTLAIRPPWVWGPGDVVDGELGARIVQGRFGWFSGGTYPYALCHVDNLCEALSLALVSNLSGVSCFVTDGEPVQLRSYLARRIEANGLAVPQLSVPTGLAWGLARLMEVAWRRLRLGGEPALTRETVRLMGYPFTLDISRARTQLAYRPVITLEQGLHQLRARPAPSKSATVRPSLVEAN